MSRWLGELLPDWLTYFKLTCSYPRIKHVSGTRVISLAWLVSFLFKFPICMLKLIVDLRICPRAFSFWHIDMWYLECQVLLLLLFGDCTYCFFFIFSTIALEKCLLLIISEFWLWIEWSNLLQSASCLPCVL